MNALTTRPSLAAFASTALVATCTLLSACGQAVNVDSVKSQLASLPMSALAAMGPVYFGDTMSFGEESSTEQVVLVAVNKP